MKKFLNNISSIHLTTISLVLAIILVAMGTLHQASSGVFSAQQNYFYAFWIWQPIGTTGLSLPLFPGGYALAIVLVINLLTAIFWRWRWNKRNIGILMTHIGLLMFIVGEIFSGALSESTELALHEGEKRSYSVAARNSEFILADLSDKQEYSLSEKELLQRRGIVIEGVGITVDVLETYPNALLLSNAIQHKKGRFAPPIADRDIGANLTAIKRSVTSQDNKINKLTSWIKITANGEYLGTWLLSRGDMSPQTFTYNDHVYALSIRPERHPLLCTMQLDSFTHKTYPGTMIPQEFTSKVTVYQGEEIEREALITMNQPLRYGGKTYYQASYGDDNTLSILQVVDNPFWAMPYLSSLLVTLGLLYQFFSHLFAFRGSHQ